MAELNSKSRFAVGVEEAGDPTDGRLLLVTIKRQAGGIVPGDILDVAGFRQDHPGTGYRKLPQMHDVPVPRHPVVRRELGHRLDDDPVRQRQGSQFDRFKKPDGHGVSSQADRDEAFFGEFADGVMRPFASEAAVLHAAIGHEVHTA